MFGATPHLSPVGARIQRHHAEYYIETGDVVFRVEDILFRVHRYFFVRESEDFRISLPHSPIPGQKIRGSSDDYPLELDDVHSDEFARLLWVFYNPMYSFEGVSVEDWTCILMLAHRWRFPNIKALAIREMEKLTMSPVRKILVYHQYECPEELLLESYTMLTLRDDPLTFDEGKDLGLEVSLRIAKARETARGQSTDAGLRSAGPLTLKEPDLTGLVKDIFNISGTLINSSSTTSQPQSTSCKTPVPTLNAITHPNGTSTNGAGGTTVNEKPGSDGLNGDGSQKSDRDKTIGNKRTGSNGRRGLGLSLWPM